MSSRFPRNLRRLAALFTWNARDREMEDEMAFHIEAMTREYIRGGMSEEEARHAARARFGSVLRIKEQGHDVRTARVLEDLARDLRHVVRGLGKNPGFTASVVLTLALGIGGNTAIFSVVDQLLLRPLPYPDGGELVMVYETMRADGGPTPGGRPAVSPANWLDWQRRSRSFETLAAWRTFPITLTGAGEAVRLNEQLVSSEFFPMLGVTPLLGRTVSEDDDRSNAPPVVVLSHRLWQTRFGGDRAVVGRMIELNGRPTQVIGVMPDGFRFVYQDNDLWGAIRLDRQQAWRDTAGRFMNVVGRLRPDASVDAARTEMDAIARNLAATHAFNKNTGVELVPLRQELTGTVETSLMVLYGAVGVLLAIACFNVANLLLARAVSRRRELTIRTSLGAGRPAIVRQLLVESVLLAVIGGLLGIALARWSLDALVASAPADLLRVPELFVDRRVLAYAFGLSALTGIVVGMVPAILVARASIAASLRAGGATVTHAPRIRQALVVCQVAMTVILLSGAGLLVRTVLALNRVDNGFDKHDLLTMEVTLPGARYEPQRRVAFYRDAVAALRTLPQVSDVGAANSLPVIGSPRGGTGVQILGEPVKPMHESRFAIVRVVTPGYFSALRTPIVRGREFHEADAATPAPGFVVNQAFVDAYLADKDPVRTSISVWMQEENPYLPIIGVVGNISEGSVRDETQPMVFYSHQHMPETGMTLFVRTLQAEALAGPAVAALRQIDPNVPVMKVRTLERALDESIARERLNALVSGGFALSGLLLASLGLYGLLAFLVVERAREIGLRLALGEQVGRLMRSIVGGGLRLAIIGSVAGVVGALGLLRSFGELLYGVTPYDLTTYAAVLTLLCVVVSLAAYIPARRAARVDPLVALRQE